MDGGGEGPACGGNACAWRERFGDARGAGIAPSQLFNWRRKALGKDLPASDGEGPAVQFTRFDPVYDSPIEVVVGDLIVRVGGNVDPDHLARVIRAARAA